MMTSTAQRPSEVVCLFQMNQLTSSEMNLLHVATTETDVADSASRIHIVATDIPRPMTQDATSRVIVLMLHSFFSSPIWSISSASSICASARGMDRMLMLYERDQLFSGTFSIVVFATRPSDTAAMRNRPQNMYALKEEYASTLTYAAAPNTMPTSAKEDFQLGSARPRKRYSHAPKSTGVIDLTVIKVSSGAYFMTSMPAYRSAKKVMTSGV
mmetsp:Transcript_13248/g.56001  ORF Transcript_13248/g.56001 Transcript_13248/m.56001 type:complete len:213 (+) Transcript_13248:266-904(+)